MPLAADDLREVEIFTDGACTGNPGPGGYGTILRSGSKTLEISAGYRRTTNNRMELLAVISGLQKLTKRCKVTLYTDSKYVANGIQLGWAKKWKSNGWRKGTGEPALNPDLWGKLLDLCDVHDVTFVWVKGHAGHPENERCHVLASGAAQSSASLRDEEYEK